MYKSLAPLVLALLTLAGSTSARHINSEGLALIKHYDGFFPNFYKDPVVSFKSLLFKKIQIFANSSTTNQNIKTIGYGHACHSSDCTHIHPPLSEHQATELLKTDLHEFEHCVDSFVSGLNENQFSALVSFTYNLGCGSLTHSTLGKELKAHNKKAAAAQFAHWVHAGRVLQGLVKRRNAERALFCKGGTC